MSGSLPGVSNYTKDMCYSNCETAHDRANKCGTAGLSSSYLMCAHREVSKEQQCKKSCDNFFSANPYGK